MNIKIKKRFSLGFLLLFLTTIIAQGTTTEKTIKGQITYLDAPLANVNISILDSKTGTSSDHPAVQVCTQLAQNHPCAIPAMACLWHQNENERHGNDCDPNPTILHPWPCHGRRCKSFC